jgi:plasmid stabilization system protein ParE
MRVVWSDGAKSDVRAITSYLAAENPAAARKWVKHLRQAARRLGRFPYSGHVCLPDAGEELRETRVANYRVFHHVTPNSVIILHVRHGARQHPWESRSDEE